MSLPVFGLCDLSHTLRKIRPIRAAQARDANPRARYLFALVCEVIEPRRMPSGGNGGP